MRGKRAAFIAGKESGLSQLPTLLAPHMHSQSRGWPSTGRGLRVCFLPPWDSGQRKKVLSRVQKTQVLILFLFPAH